MKATDNTIEWVKIGSINHLTFIGKDVVSYSKGCFIKFINMNNNNQSKLDVNFSGENGDGVAVLEGHRSLSLFSYAENRRQPTLYVKTFPSFKLISKVTSGPPEGYSAFTFSETSLLITVSNLPNYVLTIYNWRKGEKVGVLSSKLQYEEQVLKCNWSKPIYFAQMCRNRSKLFLWDIFACCKSAVMAEHEIELPPNEQRLKFRDILWTTEGGLYIIDTRACVYYLANEKYLERAIKEDLEGNAPPSICWYKGGIAVSGPNCEIRHYKKLDSWECDWKLALDTPVKYIICNKTDYIIGLTIDDRLMKFTNDEKVFLRSGSNSFDNICMIYPTGQYFVALRMQKFLSLYQTNSGELINEMALKNKALVAAENPEFPYVALGYETGLLEFISCYNPEKMSVMASFYLSKNPINMVKFFELGRIIVTGSLEIGEFFLIEGLPGTHMKVITAINTKCQIVDYMLVASKNCYRLFAIPVTGKYLAGDKMLRYCVVSKNDINVKEYKFENEEFLYHRLIPTSKFNRDRIMYAVPFNSRSIHLLEVKRGDDLVHLNVEIKTGHLLRKFDMHLTRYYALTWGYDGFVIARGSDFVAQIGMALPCHRYLGGVKKAFIHPLGKYILSLGRDNTLVCTKMEKNLFDPDRNYAITDLMESTKFALMFRRPTIGFKPEERFENLTWVEVEKLLEAEREEEICAPERAAILKEFENIKLELNELVTKNTDGPENERLDLSEFFLDTALLNYKKEINKEECKRTEIYLKALIEAQDRVTNYLMENCWHAMNVKRTTICSIFSNSQVTNFTLLPDETSKTVRLAWVQQRRKLEMFVTLIDHFKPWNMIPPNVLEEFKQPLCIKLEDYDNTKKIYGAAIDEVVSTQSTETEIAMCGKVSQKYILSDPCHYDQREITSYHQQRLQQHISDEDIFNLKSTFNKAFDEMISVKQREMGLIKERQDRLRHIVSEFNYFSENKIAVNIIDPLWRQVEMPEMITKVYDNELTITPYISPSEQAILDAKAAEEERIRLALLADDFKERALMAMMNGVLEVRWEDELKKDVPVPQCMIDKQPENFNEDDLRAIRDYEEKVAFLNSERERYKNLLDIEFTKVSTSVRESIKRFNQKLKDLIDFKMEIQSAVQQEQLIMYRNRLVNSQRCDMFKKRDTLHKLISDTEVTIANLKKTISFVQEALVECRNNQENLQMKDKVLERAFKKDFQESSPVLQEQATKLYRKRPKVSYRHINSFTLLFELAKSVISGERPFFLTHDCHEYLKALDQMDNFMGLPPIIDENTFMHICKHRRLRIEHELKMRAQQTQTQDGEATIGIFQKRLNFNRDNLAKATTEFTQLKEDYFRLTHNLQMQLVLRRGLVEMPLTGNITDFEDAIVVPKKEIEDINKLITAAGNKKIQTIMQNMAFRRKIMVMEWEHRKLRLTINDLTEQLEDIESVKVGKDMRQYLKAKALGRKTDLDSFDAEIERLGATYENRIQAKKEKLMKLEKMVHTYKQSNTALNKAINSINVDVCHLKMLKNDELITKGDEVIRARMEGLLKRNGLIQQIEKNHSEILILQTELELLRLKTYPTFRYKLINIK